MYELPPGESTWPHHYEHASEEWLLVVRGRPTLRRLPALGCFARLALHARSRAAREVTAAMPVEA